MSVLLTVNIVSHNPARSSSDNIPYYPPVNHHNSEQITVHSKHRFSIRSAWCSQDNGFDNVKRNA